MSELPRSSAIGSRDTGSLLGTSTKRSLLSLSRLCAGRDRRPALGVGDRRWPVASTSSRCFSGRRLGAGSITKIVHNALAMSIDLLLAECLTLGAKAGVSVPRLVEAFGAGCIVSGNMTFTKRMPATLFRGDFAPRFALALAYKDFRLAGDLATQHGVPTRLLALSELELLEAMNRGWGGEDRLKASTLQEERAGVTLRI